MTPRVCSSVLVCYSSQSPSSTQQGLRCHMMQGGLLQGGHFLLAARTERCLHSVIFHCRFEIGLAVATRWGPFTYSSLVPSLSVLVAKGRFNGTWQHKWAEIWLDKNSTVYENGSNPIGCCGVDWLRWKFRRQSFPNYQATHAVGATDHFDFLLLYR